MATLKLNNTPSPLSMVTFTDVPNILTISEYVAGTNATFYFTFYSGLQATVTADSQYHVTFLGESVSNVMSPKYAKNKRFYIADTPQSTAMSFCRALRNCSGIAAEFNIIHSGSTVQLIAKEIGSKWGNNRGYLDRNIPNQYLYTTGTDGAAYSNLWNSKIDVDVYKGSKESGNYVTTLEKNWYGDSTSFDVSPVLTTFSDYGKVEPYTLSVTAIQDNGEYVTIGDVSGNSAVGYECNQSDRYKYIGSPQILLNKNRDMIRYIYKPVIDFSVLSSSSNWTVMLTCFDSAMNVVYGMSVTQTSQTPLSDHSITIPQSAFTDSYYITLSFSGQVYRWNVIKPLKATEYSQRVKWRNEYGGIEFFDFTGQRSEQDTVSIDTYEKNIFDYYDSYFERKKIYNNKYEKSVTISSHLMEEKGKYVFNSMMNSKRLWSDDIVQGKTYYIIPKTIEVTEDNTYNGIFTAKLNYTYSDI